MDDRLKETLSAMMDDQADELAVRRVLSHDDQGAVHRQWQRWQQIRDVLHDAPGTLASGSLQVDVRAAVRSSLTDAEPDETSGHSAPAGAVSIRTRSRRHERWRWSAVAMIGLGVLLGFGAGTGWDNLSGLNGDEWVSIQTGAPLHREQAMPEVVLQRLDQRQWEQLNRYLLEHAQNNGLGSGQGALGYARVASVTGSGY